MSSATGITRQHWGAGCNRDRKSTRLNSSHTVNLVCRLLLEKKKKGLCVWDAYSHLVRPGNPTGTSGEHDHPSLRISKRDGSREPPAGRRIPNGDTSVDPRH